MQSKQNKYYTYKYDMLIAATISNKIVIKFKGSIQSKIPDKNFSYTSRLHYIMKNIDKRYLYKAVNVIFLKLTQERLL